MGREVPRAGDVELTDFEPKINANVDQQMHEHQQPTRHGKSCGNGIGDSRIRE